MKLINTILPHLLLKLTSRYRMVPNIQVLSQIKTDINQQLYPSIAPDFGTIRAFKNNLYLQEQKSTSKIFHHLSSITTLESHDCQSSSLRNICSGTTKEQLQLALDKMS